MPICGGYCECGSLLTSQGKCQRGKSCLTLVELAQNIRDDQKLIKELSMIIVRIIRRLPKDEPLIAHTLDYLREKNLLESPLRKTK